MNKRDTYYRKYRIQETLYIGQWCFSPLQSRHLGTSHRSLLMAAHTHSTFSGALLIAGLPECGSLSIDSQSFLKCLCHIICIAFIASSTKAFWIIQIVSMEEGSSLMQNLLQIHCSTYLVILNAMATQYTCSLSGVYQPQWLITVKSSLFTHSHSSPLSLAVRLHQCHTNCSHYINNGRNFSGQTLCYSPSPPHTSPQQEG